MSAVARNALANVFGGVWAIALSLLAIPIQIRILGAEAYGLIGFLATVQIVLVVFDLGLPPTIVRELARNADTDQPFSRELVQTGSTIYWIMALIVSIALVAASGWIASNWLNVESIPTDVVTQVLRLLAVYILFTWPLNIYVSTLAGLQQFKTINILKIISTTSAQLGGIAILLITQDITAFVLWLVLNAFVFIIIHARICLRLMPGLSLTPRIFRTAISRVWRFSLDLNLISALAVVYLQTDRVLISTLLPLRMLGYYNAAYNASRQIGTIQEFINSAMLPALSHKTDSESRDVLLDFYLGYAQLLVYVVALPTLILAFFGYNILDVWVGPEIADGGALVLSLLAIGFLVNASMSTCYTLAISTGHSRIPLIVNVAGLGIYLPMMWYLLNTYALEGAALGWILLNLYYLATLMPYVQHRVLNSSTWLWLRRVLLPFIGAGLVTFGVGNQVLLSLLPNINWVFPLLISSVLYTISGFLLLNPKMRQQLIGIPRQILMRSN